MGGLPPNSQHCGDIAGIPDNSGQARPLDCREAAECRSGFQKIARQTPGEIGDQKYSKEVAVSRKISPQEIKDTGEHEQKNNFVNLYRMARNAIAEIDRPEQICRIAVSVIRDSAEKAPQTP